MGLDEAARRRRLPAPVSPARAAVPDIADRSMRVMELGVAGLAIIAAFILALGR